MDWKKVRIGARNIAVKVKDKVIPVLGILVPGILVAGSLTAIQDHRRLSKLENKFEEHREINNKNVDIISESFRQIGDDIDNLTRQNNMLFERALKETEGKAQQ